MAVDIGMKELPEIPGSGRSEMERLLAQWPHLDEGLVAEGMDCYGDRARAEHVKASYAGIGGAVTRAARGEPILLIGRRQDRLFAGGFGRILALGELAGDGSGIFLDYRHGQVVFPTDKYALLERRSICAVTKYAGPTVHAEPLQSGAVLRREGLLPPKDELMDRPLRENLKIEGRTPLRLRSVDEEEIWSSTAEVGIGDEGVEVLMESAMRTHGSRGGKLFRHDFALLREALANPPEEQAATTG